MGKRSRKPKTCTSCGEPPKARNEFDKNPSLCYDKGEWLCHKCLIGWEDGEEMQGVRNQMYSQIAAGSTLQGAAEMGFGWRGGSND